MDNNRQKVILKAKTTDSQNTEYRFNLEYYIFIDDGAYISYCPALDLSTSGKTFNDAVLNFYECFQLYIEYCIDNNTLEADLVNHGWKITKRTVTPPSFNTLLKKQEVKNLVGGNKPYEKIVIPARVACHA